MSVKDDGTEYCDCCGVKFDEASAAEDADICPSCARELWPDCAVDDELEHVPQEKP